jgi:hypothetical protein
VPNTKDNKPDIYNSSFFLIGDSGSQKTRMSSTYPDPYFFDFDKGTASIDRDVEYDTFKDAAKGAKVMPEIGIYAYGEAYPRFLDKVNAIGELIDKGTCPFKTLTLDSATVLSNICMNYVLKADGKPAGTQPQIQHWGRQTALLETVFDQLTAWPLIKIVTAHVQRTQNDLLQTVEMLPLLTGKFAAKSAIYFDEVYFLEIERKKEGDKTVLKSVCRTQSTPILKQAKSRFGIKDGIDANWESVLKAFNERKKAA